MKAELFKVLDDYNFIFKLERWRMYHFAYPRNSENVYYVLCSVREGAAYVHYCNDTGHILSPLLGICRSGDIESAASKASVNLVIPQAIKVLYGRS